MAVKDSVGGFKDNAHVYRTPKACSSVKMFLGTYVKSVMETFGRQNLICPFAVVWKHYINANNININIFNLDI